MWGNFPPERKKLLLSRFAKVGKCIVFVNVSAFQIRMAIKVKHKNKKKMRFLP